MEDMLAVLQAHQHSQALGAPDPEASGPGQLAADAQSLPCSLGLLHSLHGLMDAADPTLRHRGFMLLRRLGGEPATLYRDIEEDDVGGTAGTAGGSMARVLAAACAPGCSVTFRGLTWVWQVPTVDDNMVRLAA